MSSLLRSTERLLEGNIGDVNINPLIGYSITLYELSLIDNKLSNTINSLLPITKSFNDLQGKISGSIESNLNNISLDSFIKEEVMKFWFLPKKVSVKLYEKSELDIYVIRPRIIEDYLLVEEVSSVSNNYYQETYSLGLGEYDEVIGTQFWRCNYIESIKVYSQFRSNESWIKWEII